MKNFVLFLSFLIAAFAHNHGIKFDLPKDANGNVLFEGIPCGTQEVFDWKVKTGQIKTPNVSNSQCYLNQCDNPAFRDAADLTPIVIRVAYTVGNNAISNAQVDKMHAFLNTVYGSVGISFQNVKTQFVTHKFGTSNCIPAYMQDNYDWWYAIDSFKTKFAINPATTLNIFVTCQVAGTQGTLMGIATFPWDSNARQNTGGLWMNNVAMLESEQTLEHEVGHCFGLWHTFHGVNEVSACSVCYEVPHPVQLLASDKSNGIGDLCGDTLATPMDYYCTQPAGTSVCTSEKWSKYNVDFDNVMGYAMLNPTTRQRQSCRTELTDLQMKRMHCYLRSSLLNPWICPNGVC